MGHSITDIREKILSGQNGSNVSFTDLLKLVRSFGLKERSGGNHPHLFSGTSKAGNPIFLNLQADKNNKVKPYQAYQVRRAIENHEL